ncbi:MAG: hypothetical protein AAGK98_03675 [Pseudomonadota bacterium]
MHFRFVVPRWCPWARAEIGIFTCATPDSLIEGDGPDWLWDEICEQRRWFDDNLAAPDRLGLQFKRRRSIWGVCWFRHRATEHISRARYLGWLLTEAGLPVLELRREDPGQILWSDAHQVVAKVAADHPRAFGRLPVCHR